MSRKAPERQKKHLTTILHSTDVALLFERQNMPLKCFALNHWQLACFCNFPWHCNHWLENPKAKGFGSQQILEYQRLKASTECIDREYRAHLETTINFLNGIELYMYDNRATVSSCAKNLLNFRGSS